MQALKANLFCCCKTSSTRSFCCTLPTRATTTKTSWIPVHFRYRYESRYGSLCLSCVLVSIIILLALTIMFLVIMIYLMPCPIVQNNYDTMHFIMNASNDSSSSILTITDQGNQSRSAPSYIDSRSSMLSRLTMWKCPDQSVYLIHYINETF